MSYGLKYIMQWASQNANANDYRIELYQKDYSGDTTVKKLGSAPSLVMDNADNGIMGTSLQFSIQADTDGELQELYTTDAKKFKCLLLKNDKQIWAGYILQELYSEDYIAAPYDVGVTATDQLALLKDVPYVPIGRKTLLEIIHNAITPTQLELGYSVQTSLKPQLQDSDIPFISFVTIDDGGYINYSCYEVISMIMRTCNMTITQIENRWVIARKSDISAEIFSYDSALNLIGQAEPNALVIGRMYENDIWPVGNLVRKFTAVSKALKFAFSPIVKSSFFNNPTMEGTEYWQSNGTYIEQAPGKYKVTVNRLEYNYNVNAWILRSSNRKTKDFALWQSIDVEQGGASLSLKISYCPMRVLAGDDKFLEKFVSEAKLTVQIKLEADSEEIYYLTKEGWKLEDAGDLTYTANPVNDNLRQRGNKDQYSSAVINFPAIPANGVLTISFRNDSVHYLKSDASNMEPFYSPYVMGVTDVMLTAPDVVGYDSDVILNAQGNSSVEQELFFSDAYGIGNEEKSLYNFIRIGDSDTSDWLLGKSTFETFFKAMVQDTANLASLKNHYSGVISGTLQIGLLYYEKFSGDILRMERGTLDLLTEDLNGEWLQVPVSDAVYDEIELNTNENNVVKPASVSTSIPTGNFASTDALDALTKIVNILDSIIGLDEDDEAYVKPKSDGSARNFYSLGEVSSGGKNGKDEEGEGDGTGITSLYDIPEIVISVATLADGQSLVYDATSGKWVNRLVQGNAESATKLQTARKIWGNSFDGTADITGNLNLNNNRSIRSWVADGSTDYDLLYLSTANNFQIGYGAAIVGKLKTNLHGYGIDFRSKGTDGATMSLTTDGNVGIGTTTPAYKLDVNGTTRLNGKVTLTRDVVLNNYTAIKFKDSNDTELNTIMVGTDNALTIGADHSVKNYETRIKGVGVTLFHGGTQVLSLTSTELITAKGITPFVGNTYDLGSSSNRWQDVYCYNLDAATRIIMQVPGFTYPCAKIIRDTSTNKVYYQAGLVDGSAKQGKMGFSGIDATKLASLDINSTLTTISDKLFVTGDIALGKNIVLNNSCSIKSYIADGSTTYDLLYLSPANNFQIGYGAAIVGKLKTNLHGYGIDFRSKGTESVTMSLLTNGHVLIGSTTDTADYIFRVGGRGYFNSAIDVGNSAAIRVKDNYGNVINAISMDGLNQLLIGSGTFSYGYPTYLYGHSIGFRLTHGIQPLTISSEGIATFTKMSHHNEGIKIGEATLVWDAENQCLVVDKDFAGLGEISSGGISSVIGSGGVVEEDVAFSGNVAFNGPVKINRGLVLNSGLQVGNETDYKSIAVYGSVDIYSKLWLKNNLTAGEVSERWAIINFSDDGYVDFDHSVRCISLVQTSDITLKQIIEDVCLPTEVIANAPLFRFTWENSTDKAVHIGTSAQYWLGYAPELTALYDGKYNLDYATLGVLMGKSNASEIEQLKKRVKELENEVTRLKGGNYAV